VRKLLPAGVALAVIIGAYPAQADGMPAYKGRVPANAWTGCYVGGNLGGGWARKEYTDPLAKPPETILGGHTADGVVGGGQIGCDYQIGPWVLGAQALLDRADLKASHLALGDFYGTEIRWFATTTARLGYTLHPSLLAYVRGGAAWVRDEETKTDLATRLLEGTANVTRTGWTVGAGAEYLIATNWSIFAEYNYMDFGSRRTDFRNLEVPPIPPTFPLDIQQTVQTVTIGFNFRF
jgi:outer membrane immunogenic protein